MRIANIIEGGGLDGPQVRVTKALQGQVETAIFLPCANSGTFRPLCVRNGIAHRIRRITQISREYWPRFVLAVFALHDRDASVGLAQNIRMIRHPSYCSLHIEYLRTLFSMFYFGANCNTLRVYFIHI